MGSHFKANAQIKMFSIYKLPTPDLKGNLADLPSAQGINCVLGNPSGLKTLCPAQTRPTSRDHKKTENIRFRLLSPVKDEQSFIYSLFKKIKNKISFLTLQEFTVSLGHCSDSEQCITERSPAVMSCTNTSLHW